MGGRTDIEPDDVVQFLGEGGIVGEFELPPAMRGDAVDLPDLLNRGDRQPRDLGHGPRRPMGGLVRWRLQRHRHNRGCLVVGDRRLAGRAGLVVQQPVDAFGHEAGLPTPDRRLGGLGCRHDRGRAETVGAHQHDPGSPDVLLRRVAISDEHFQPAPVGIAECDGDPCAHAPESHRQTQNGIPIRTLPFRSIH